MVGAEANQNFRMIPGLLPPGDRMWWHDDDVVTLPLKPAQFPPTLFLHLTGT
jgi:hypothetical protein